MRPQGARTVRLAPIDDDNRPRPHHDLETRRMDAADERIIRAHIRSERSSAFWFAASIWGVSGLVIGGILGSFLTFLAMDSSLPLAAEAMSRGMAVEQARQRVESRPPLNLEDSASPSQSTP